MARVSLAYPKIPASSAAPLAQCIAFEKYDGTNIHWVWDRELGWHAFGMRRNRYDLDDTGVSQFHESHEGFAGIVELFRSTLAKQLSHIFETQADYSCEQIVVFTEFLGEQSFAGLHRKEDPKQLVLIDVKSQSGMVPPAKFVADFSELNAARVVYRGKLSGKFADDVRNGKFNVFEGVVCKGGEPPDQLWMVKIKTNAYMERLKLSFAEKWETYWE